MLRCQALSNNTLGPAWVPHEVMAAVVGGIVQHAALYLSDAASEGVRLNTTIKAAALQFEGLPKDRSNVMVPVGKGLGLSDVRVLYCDSVLATVA